MDSARHVTPGRQRRLAEELVDEGTGIIDAASDPGVMIDELDYALHPPRHERRIPAYGAIVMPTVSREDWGERTGLDVTVNQAPQEMGEQIRRLADGLSSWHVRSAEGSAIAIFNRAAGSERDLVVLAESTGGIVVQRRHDSEIRVVGSFGVARFDGANWHVEPPFGSWLQQASCGINDAETDMLERILRFAVHDLGANGIGALLVMGTLGDGTYEERMAQPPPLRITEPSHLGPLRHVLSQVDGSAVFDAAGTLRNLGVRLIPSAEAERNIDAMGGTRHTSARRYSYDDPTAIIVAVSESGPVTVFRRGEIIGRSPESMPHDRLNDQLSGQED